jgi:tRNA nucleotidyltransferase (CCA-adding enzyme)
MAEHDPQAVLAALARYPRLPAADGRVAAVGGFVRDVWLGREPRELDVVIEGDAVAFARALGGELVVHEPFGTASASGPGWRVDVAAARRERYPAPGALPLVAPASIEEDLPRRDFTANAIAVTVEGELIAASGAVEDLGARTLRVFHDSSFTDDPTRIVRLERLAARLGFAIEPHTAELARRGGFDALSGSRLGAELRLTFEEPDTVAVLAALAGRLPIEVDRDVLAAALALAPPEADRAMLVLGAVASDAAWLSTLGLTARELEIVRAVRDARVPDATAPSALWRAWRHTPVEAVAVAGARGDRGAARRWIEDLRSMTLEIRGEDLIAAGVPQGPEIGRRLTRTLERKLDGKLAGGRDAELADALAGEA